MTDFDRILKAATKHVGGEEALAARMPEVSNEDDLRSMPDDRYLSLMSQRIFRAGLKHSLVDAKWPVFEQTFFAFDPGQVESMNDETLEGLMSDTRLIRHWGKIKSVRANAAELRKISHESGGFGGWLAEWPEARIVDLWNELAKRFTQLGGSSAPAFLRMAGKDTFMLTDAVVRGLNHWGIFDGTPKSKAEKARVQAAFNDWAATTGRPLAHLSMTLALSTE